MRTVAFADGAVVPAVGQGTWRMGEGGNAAAEADALRLGLDLGLTLIDTAEMYGEGAAERVVARAIAGRRHEVFVVSKVYPQNANRRAMARSCEASLRRLGTDWLDLYLLHWRGSTPLAETVEAFERLREAGKVRRWGVSNLDPADMAELGPGAAANQVLYNLEHRGIEFDLLPQCRAAEVSVMAYSPVGQGGALLRHPALVAVAARHGASTAQVAIAWTIRGAGVVSIPKASVAGHVRENAAAGDLVLTGEDLAALDAAFAPPRGRRALAML